MASLKIINWGEIPSMFNLTILLFYMGVLVFVTSVLSLRTRDPDPMLGGRNMPWWLVAASIVGTNLSSVAFLVIPILGYTMDINAIIGNLLDGFIASIVVGIFFVKFLRKTRDASIYTLLNDRFGREISLYASSCFIAFQILRSGLILFLVGQALHFISNAADVNNTIIICGLIVIFYTYMTGIEGVMWTDFFQTILLVIAGGLALFFIGNSISNSLFTQNLNWPDVSSILKNGVNDNSFAAESLGITILFFVTSSISTFSSDQKYAQRYLVAKSTSHARKGLFAAGIGGSIVLSVFILIGIGLFAFYKLNSNLLPADVSNNQIFAHFISKQFPNGLLGLAIVGILAAAMSSMDSCINSGSTVFYCNFWKPFTKKTKSRVLQNMNVMRKCSLIFGVLSIIAALFIHRYSENIIDFWLKSGSLIVEGLLGLFILMRISKKVGRKSALVALPCGMSFLFWATLSKDISFIPDAPFHYMWGLPVGTVIMVTVGLIYSRIFDEEPVEISEPFIHSEEARKSIAKKRKRAKKNMFADSIRPKPFYQLYAGIGVMIVAFMWHDGDMFGFENIPNGLLALSGICLTGVLIGPFVIRNYTNKRYLYANLGLLTIALPFVSATTMFIYPNEPIYAYLFLGSIACMGTMVGWTMLGMGTMLGTCAASLSAMIFYEKAATPDNWMMVAIVTVAIFIYFAMDAAKEKMYEEKYLGKVNTIVKKIYGRVINCVLDLKNSGHQLSISEMLQVTGSIGEVSQTLKALQGATDVDPEEGQMELSVQHSLQDAINSIPFSEEREVRRKIVFSENSLDFRVLGSKEVFVNILCQILDNGIYYIKKGQANTITCHLDRARRILTISNDGPPVEPKDVPYIFDIGYTTKDADGLGVGLTYCKQMLEGMRGGIRLTSKPSDKHCEFKLYFPFSYDGRKLDDEDPLLDETEN